MNNRISRGDVWLVDLDPAVGHEQAKRRPCLVVSVDIFNQGPGELAVVVPFTSRFRNLRWHVPAKPSEAGVSLNSYIMCDQPRAVSFDRFSGKRFGKISHHILEQVEQRLRFLLGL